MRCFLLLLMVCISHCVSYSQDSLLMRVEKVQYENLLERQQRDRTPKSQVATGELMDLGMIPQTVVVITSEDILRQNINTLTDLMRLIPGAVISPVGNALEGEKYMLNGLSGNSYVKIMINGVPIKPTFLPGMPIGAQLPIRQADRVEVLIGSASVYFGEDACAGVVNIILEETERPVFTRTNLGFGRLGYNDLDLTFGGKTGKDKNIFHFTVYGRSTIQGNRNIFYSAPKLYKYGDYALYPNLRSVYENNENLFPNPAQKDSIAVIFGAPTESRQIGGMLLWRGIRFGYNLLSRSEYSSVGLNPAAVAYWRPGDRTGERIETFAMQLRRVRTRRQVEFIGSVLRYRSTQTSLKTHVFGAMGQTFFHELRQGLPSNEQDQVAQDILNLFYSNQRNIVNQGLDLRTQLRASFVPRRGWRYSTGILTGFSIGSQYSDLLDRPAASSSIIPFPDSTQKVKPILPQGAVDLTLDYYNQLMYQNKRMTLVGAISGFVKAEGLTLGSRLSGLYRMHRVLSAYAHYGSGYAVVSPFYYGSTLLTSQDLKTVKQLPVFDPSSDAPTLLPQLAQHVEVGLRGQRGLVSGQVCYVYQGLKQSIEGGYRERGTDKYGLAGDYTLYGYKNDIGSQTHISAIRLEATVDTIKFDLTINNKHRKWFVRQYLHLQLSGGRRIGVADANGQRIELDAVPNYPRFIMKDGITLVNPRFDFSLIYQRQSAAIGQLELYRARYPNLQGKQINPKGRNTIDFTSRFFANKNFSIWIDIRNLFNTEFDGIDAFGTPDDLFTNPQPTRSFRFGVQYNLD